jgi:predicted transposase YbfD/YdcC
VQPCALVGELLVAVQGGDAKRAVGRDLGRADLRHRACGLFPVLADGLVRQAGVARSYGRSHDRVFWIADAVGIDFPHVSPVARIRRDRYDADRQLISKQIVHAVTSLSEHDADAASLAKIARGQWGIESAHWIRDTAFAEDENGGYAGNCPRIMATLRDLAVSMLYLSGARGITGPCKP